MRTDSPCDMPRDQSPNAPCAVHHATCSHRRPEVRPDFKRRQGGCGVAPLHLGGKPPEWGDKQGGTEAGGAAVDGSRWEAGVRGRSSGRQV